MLQKVLNEVAKNSDCSTLVHTLTTIPGAKGITMGHTIQQSGINRACNSKAIRIDVGMSKGCTNGLPEVLEINKNSAVKILTSNPLYQNKQKSYMDANIGEMGLGCWSPNRVQNKWK
ncbi:hypothetical protein SAY86_005822 [Trapa natans]|uniref:Uncharacterized protein n=1 Tax=Trapa natans TaxID=22666 RepID=A0AAN7L450_TRANT|nr:hypothetical protein SAY86_005822 [Trapa natans]